jgi:uncharacterized membrane protein YsdA (DUF1294 family)
MFVKPVDSFAIVWFAAANLLVCGMFGVDKWFARRGRQRISEFSLVLVGALGGWPGGLVGMYVFRHKTAKWTFQLKYAMALIPFAAEIWGFLQWR